MGREMIIDGIAISYHNLHYASLLPIPTAEQDTEHVEVRGRNGSLTKKYGYKDILYRVELYIREDVPFKKSFRLSKPFLLGAKKLKTLDDPEVFYRVKSVRIEDAENEILKFGRFVVEFRLDPFQYELTESTQTITSQTTLTNEGHESQPLITAQVAGSGWIYINDQEIGITDINGPITIDSELMNAYKSDNGIITNLNNHMVGDFPIFEHGPNVIKFDGDISSLEINPRWRWV